MNLNQAKNELTKLTQAHRPGSIAVWLESLSDFDIALLCKFAEVDEANLLEYFTRPGPPRIRVIWDEDAPEKNALILDEKEESRLGDLHGDYSRLTGDDRPWLLRFEWVESDEWRGYES